MDKQPEEKLRRRNESVHGRMRVALEATEVPLRQD